MGGRGSTHLAMKYPELFCSLFNQSGNVLHVSDPALLPNAYLGSDPARLHEGQDEAKQGSLCQPVEGFLGGLQCWVHAGKDSDLRAANRVQCKPDELSRFPVVGRRTHRGRRVYAR